MAFAVAADQAEPPVVIGHAVGRNAARLRRAQKEKLEKILASTYHY